MKTKQLPLWVCVRVRVCVYYCKSLNKEYFSHMPWLAVQLDEDEVCVYACVCVCVDCLCVGEGLMEIISKIC